MKKFLCAILFLTMVISLSACGGTVLKNYPLYCPKCKQETLIEAENLKVTVIKKQEN